MSIEWAMLEASAQPQPNDADTFPCTIENTRLAIKIIKKIISAVFLFIEVFFTLKKR